MLLRLKDERDLVASCLSSRGGISLFQHDALRHDHHRRWRIGGEDLVVEGDARQEHFVGHHLDERFAPVHRPELFGFHHVTEGRKLADVGPLGRVGGEPFDELKCFVAILGVTLAYLWRSGALDWNEGR